MKKLSDISSMYYYFIKWRNRHILSLSLCALITLVSNTVVVEAQQKSPALTADLAQQQHAIQSREVNEQHFKLALPTRAPQSDSVVADDNSSEEDALLAAAPPPTNRQDLAPAPTESAESALWTEKGLASWYAGRFQGRTTANGETFDTNSLTAAHKTLPFNSIVEVYNPHNKRSVLVRINDRGPFVEGRVIDLSRAAAGTLGITTSGISEVYLRVVRQGTPAKDRLHLIQIGSFAQHQNALDLVQDLRQAGFNPVIESQNNTLFRVVIPNIPLRQVEQYQMQLAHLGYSDVLVRLER